MPPWILRTLVLVVAAAFPSGLQADPLKEAQRLTERALQRLASGNLDGAEELALRSLRLRRTREGANAPTNAPNYYCLGMVMGRRGGGGSERSPGHEAGALVMLLRAAELAEKDLETHRELAEKTYAQLAKLHTATRRQDLGIRAAERLFRLRLERLGDLRKVANEFGDVAARMWDVQVHPLLGTRTSGRRIADEFESRILALEAEEDRSVGLLLMCLGSLHRGRPEKAELATRLIKRGSAIVNATGGAEGNEFVTSIAKDHALALGERVPELTANYGGEMKRAAAGVIAAQAKVASATGPERSAAQHELIDATLSGVLYVTPWSTLAMATANDLIAAAGTKPVPRVRALEKRARVSLSLGLLPDATADAREVVALTRKSGFKPMEPALALGALAYYLTCEAKFAEAFAVLQEATPLYKKHADPWRLQRHFTSLAVLAVELAHFKQANEAIDAVFAMLRDESSAKALIAEEGRARAAREFRRHYFDLRVICRRLARPHDEVFLVNSKAANLLGANPTAGYFERLAGDYHAATLAERRALLGNIRDGHAEIKISWQTAELRVELAKALTRAGMLTEALAEITDATDHITKDAGYVGRSQRGSFHLLVESYSLLAEILLKSGLTAEARATAERAVDLHGRYALGQAFMDRPAPIRYEAASRPIHGIVRFVRKQRPPPDLRTPELLAQILLAEGDTETATDMVKLAIADALTLVPAMHPRMASLHHTLARVHLASKAWDEASAQATKARQVLEGAYGPMHPELVPVFLTHGDIALLKGDAERARHAYGAALAAAKAALNKTHPDMALAYNGLALAQLATGDHPASIKSMGTVLDLVEARIRELFPGSTHPQRMALAASVQWALGNWVHICGAAGHEGYREVLRMKALAGRALAEEERLLRTVDPKLAPMVETLRAAQRKLARVSQQRLPWGMPRGPWRRRVAEASDDVAKLTRDVARKDRRFKTLTSTMAPKIKKLLGALPKGRVLIDVLWTGGRYVAWVLVKGKEPVRIDLGESEAIDEQVSAFRDSVTDATNDSDKTFLEAGSRLRATIWDPLAAQLPEGVKDIYFVLDGALAAVPWTALPSKGAFLGESLTFHRLVDAQDLLAPARKSGKGLVLVGDVDFNRAVRKGASRQAITGLRPLRQRGRVMRPFVPLPGTKAEIAAIEQLYVNARGPKFVTVFAEDRATEAGIREACAGARILHFATHGIVRDDIPHQLQPRGSDQDRLSAGLERHLVGMDPMLLSGLALSGANTRIFEGEDDGMLTAREASEFSLESTDLVFLSACETARGVTQAGEGVTGLVSGFKFAGAAQVLAGLWPVEDEATRVHAERFHAAWLKAGKRASAATVLQEVTQALRKERKLTAPSQWAAFVAYGRP